MTPDIARPRVTNAFQNPKHMTASPILGLIALAEAEQNAIDRLVAAGALTPQSARAVGNDGEQLLHGATKRNIVHEIARGYYVDQARYAEWKAAQRGPRPPRGVLVGLVISAAVILASLALIFTQRSG
ncbi:MAG: hypothetical protein H0W30_12565 [Gemmatimonadaceae bacterium]|nr:hypothetical protein [Gemmatimonadaceae bacterium]